MSEPDSKASATDIYLKPGQAIILDRDLAIEYLQESGGVGLLKSVQKFKVDRFQ